MVIHVKCEQKEDNQDPAVLVWEEIGCALGPIAYKKIGVRHSLNNAQTTYIIPYVIRNDYTKQHLISVVSSMANETLDQMYCSSLILSVNRVDEEF